MLQDRNNWPTITLPNPGAQAGTLGYRRGPSINPPEANVEMEEDVSRGDLLDFMTPRDISRTRYEQHHEWMEEVLESPYPTMSIIPTDLGLGRKGILEDLTKDFFHAPTGVLQETSGNVRVGKMAPGKADEFVQRASQKLAEMQAEMEKLRAKHAKRVAKMQKVAQIGAAEKKLRNAGSASLRRTSSSQTDKSVEANGAQTEDDIVQHVEQLVSGKVGKAVQTTLVSKGGLDDRSYGPAFMNSSAAKASSSPVKSDTITPAANTSETPRDQISEQQPALDRQASVNSTTAASTTAPPAVESIQSTTNEQAIENTPQDLDLLEQDENDNGNEMNSFEQMTADINMDGLDDDGNGGDTNMEGQDWVMIDEQGNQSGDNNVPSEGSGSNQAPSAASGHNTGQDQSPVNADLDQQSKAVGYENQQDDRGGDQETFKTGDFDMGNDFDDVDVDTAGDALASYGDGDSDGDDDLNLENMDGSAFGDAFGDGSGTLNVE